MVNRIGIIGRGNVGSAIERGLGQTGYETRTTGRDPKEVAEVAAWAELIVLAVPYTQRQDAARAIGAGAQGKTVVDVTNALGEGMAFSGSLQRSGAEELQGWVRGGRVVKAFNTVFAQHMDKGNVHGEPLTLFVAGDDGAAKQEVQSLGEAIGFESVDAGPLEHARWLEALGYLNITLAYKAGLGGDGGFRYVLPEAARARHERPKPGSQRERPRPATR